jgi:hypothetical protein
LKPPVASKKQKKWVDLSRKVRLPYSFTVRSTSGKILSPLTRPRTLSGLPPIQTHPARRRMVRLRELPASLPEPASGGTWRAPVASTGHGTPGRRPFGVSSTSSTSE